MEYDYPQHSKKSRNTSRVERTAATVAAKQPCYGFADQKERPSKRREPATNDFEANQGSPANGE
jgi:hypothetical protein